MGSGEYLKLYQVGQMLCLSWILFFQIAFTLDKIYGEQYLNKLISMVSINLDGS